MNVYNFYTVDGQVHTHTRVINSWTGDNAVHVAERIPLGKKTTSYPYFSLLRWTRDDQESAATPRSSSTSIPS